MKDETRVPVSTETLATLLSKHALPLGLKSDSNDSPWTSVSRATFTLLWTGSRHVFVTCFHVSKRLREMQEQNSLAQLVGYSGPPFCEISGFSLLDEDERLDIAIFGGLQDKVALPKAQFIDYDLSYLLDPNVGEAVSIVGYPGSGVTVTENKADFGFMHIGFNASSVSGWRITLADEHGSRQFIHYDDPNSTGIVLGGLSGSPAFIWRGGQPRFVGIVTDASDKDQTILISRLSHLKHDGTLDRNLIPW